MAKNSLFERLCRYPHLADAWQKVKTAGSAGGIDQVTVHQFEKTAQKELNRLCADLKDGSYVSQPYKAGSIPKDHNTSREIGLLTVRDKIVQQGMQMLLYPLVDRQLLPSCYAYRKGKGAIKAVKRVRHAIDAEKCTFMVSCDIKGYFDHIPHKPLFDILKNIIHDERMLELVELCVRMGSVKRGNRWKDTPLGIPQGGVISPLLANLFLTPLDKAVLETGCSYIRYADDFVTLARTPEAAEAGLKAITSAVDSLQLSLKAEGKVETIEQGFVFLGVEFSKTGIAISEPKKERMKEKLMLNMRASHPERIQRVADTIRGFHAFYGQLFKEAELVFVDQYLMELVAECARKENLGTLNALQLAFGNLLFLTSGYRNNPLDHLRMLTKKGVVEKAEKPKRLPKTKQTVDRKIASRKLEYQKLEAKGKELIINTYGAILGINQGKVSVRGKVDKHQTIPITNLSHISILSNGVSFSSDFVYHCTTNNIPVSFFTRSGEHYATLFSPKGTDNALWMNQLQSASGEAGQQVTRSLVVAKIRNQANLLKYFHKYHKGADQGFAQLFSRKITGMTKLIKDAGLKTGPLEVTMFRQEMMGIEAQASLIYWELVQELINDDCTFTGRERQGAKDLTNSMLNYGYAILYARVWEAVVSARLNPYISFLHTPDGSKPTLVFDLVENFRQQVVDRVVISLLQKREKLEVKGGWLSEETRAKLTENIYERLHRYETFRGEKRRMSDIIKMQAQSLTAFLNGKTKSFKPYVSKW